MCVWCDNAVTNQMLHPVLESSAVEKWPVLSGMFRWVSIWSIHLFFPSKSTSIGEEVLFHHPAFQWPIEATHLQRLARFNRWHLNLSSHYQFFNESINQLIIIKLASNKEDLPKRGKRESTLDRVLLFCFLHFSPFRYPNFSCRHVSMLMSVEYRLKKPDNYMIIFHPLLALLSLCSVNRWILVRMPLALRGYVHLVSHRWFMIQY